MVYDPYFEIFLNVPNESGTDCLIIFCSVESKGSKEELLEMKIAFSCLPVSFN